MFKVVKVESVLWAWRIGRTTLNSLLQSPRFAFQDSHAPITN